MAIIKIAHKVSNSMRYTRNVFLPLVTTIKVHVLPRNLFGILKVYLVNPVHLRLLFMIWLLRNVENAIRMKHGMKIKEFVKMENNVDPAITSIPTLKSAFLKIVTLTHYALQISHTGTKTLSLAIPVLKTSHFMTLRKSNAENVEITKLSNNTPTNALLNLKISHAALMNFITKNPKNVRKKALLQCVLLTLLSGIQPISNV